VPKSSSYNNKPNNRIIFMNICVLCLNYCNHYHSNAYKGFLPYGIMFMIMCVMHKLLQLLSC
jgi:hypothetical protein